MASNTLTYMNAYYIPYSCISYTIQVPVSSNSFLMRQQQSFPPPPYYIKILSPFTENNKYMNEQIQSYS